MRRDTGTVLDSNDVSVVTIALASMVNLYFPDLSKRRRCRRSVAQRRGVTLVVDGRRRWRRNRGACGRWW
ncbi:MAG: hypothetical protein IPP90_21020 [Gemmatimonadaceae bacterium]|nr:hypothetical protein [Gemmatimonadaceae bacterium]